MMRRLGSQRYTPTDYAESQLSLDTHFSEMEPSDFESKSSSGDEGGKTSPSRDSGISELSARSIEKRELGSHCAELCKDLKTVSFLTQHFLADVMEEKENPRDLLDELETKIRPCLITLDQDLNVQERLLRKNLDQSTISDNRVNWLLEYNRCQLEFRRLFTYLTNDVCDDFEHVLRLRARGCQGLAPHKHTAQFLQEMGNSLEKVDRAIRVERCRRN